MNTYHVLQQRVRSSIYQQPNHRQVAIVRSLHQSRVPVLLTHNHTLINMQHAHTHLIHDVRVCAFVQNALRRPVIALACHLHQLCFTHSLPHKQTRQTTSTHVRHSLHTRPSTLTCTLHPPLVLSMYRQSTSHRFSSLLFHSHTLLSLLPCSHTLILLPHTHPILLATSYTHPCTRSVRHNEYRQTTALTCRRFCPSQHRVAFLFLSRNRMKMRKGSKM